MPVFAVLGNSWQNMHLSLPLHSIPICIPHSSNSLFFCIPCSGVRRGGRWGWSLYTMRTQYLCPLKLLSISSFLEKHELYDIPIAWRNRSYSSTVNIQLEEADIIVVTPHGRNMTEHLQGKQCISRVANGTMELGKSSGPASQKQLIKPKWNLFAYLFPISTVR